MMFYIYLQLILDVWKKENLITEGSEEKKFEVYKIPLSLLNLDRTIIFQSHNFDYENFNPDLNKFDRFISENYRELNEVPKEQIKVWHADKKVSRSLFWYSHIMHILSESEIDISDCEVIFCK